jgi:hypothetical protein
MDQEPEYKLDYMTYYKTQWRYTSNKDKVGGYRCKICKEVGHNRRSCPYLKKTTKKNI